MGATRASDQNEILALRASLFDGTTRLPAYAARFERLKALAADQVLGLVFLQVADMGEVEAVHGCQTYEEVLRRAAARLDVVNHSEFAGALEVCQRGVFDDQFCVFLPFSHLSSSPLEEVERVGMRLRDALAQELEHGPHAGLRAACGTTLLPYNPFLRFERQVHRAVERAALAAQRQESALQLRHADELRSILSRGALRTLFQPVVDLSDLAVVGFEALTRGPESTPHESPEHLFACARSSRLARELDRQCKLSAFEAAKGKPKSAHLFVNTLPDTMDDPELAGEAGVEHLRRSGIRPEEVVWELTERHAIRDYDAFDQVLRGYTDLGYRVAIDDVGAGYSSIQAITHVRPAYLKVDRSIVHGVEDSLLKQELVASLLVLSRKIQAHLVAEGIQEARTLDVLRELGVPMGQGYHLGRPAPGFLAPKRRARKGRARGAHLN